MTDGSTHWEGCWREHHECAVAEVERLREENARLLAANKDCIAHFEDARDEAEALRKDAERYQTLREWHCGGQRISHPLVPALLGLVEGRRRWPIPSAQFDAAIDAAMSAA